MTITKAVMLKSMKFVIVNTLYILSWLQIPLGSISNRHVQTPPAHQILMSADDLRFKTLMIRDAFQNGSRIAAKKDILINISISASECRRNPAASR